MNTHTRIAAATFLLAAHAAFAQGPVRLGADLWMSSGESTWDISGFEGFLDDSFRSELKWEETDSAMIVVRADMPLAPGLRVEGEYGFGSIDDGRNRDRDWISSPLFAIDDELISESVAETDGDLRLASASLAFRVAADARSGSSLDLIAGYLTFTEDLRDRNGTQTLDLLGDEPTPYPLDGLDSTFDFSWQAWRIGARVEFPLANRLRVSLFGAALVGVAYEGEGYWNLRVDDGPDGFRDRAPNFEQEADGGFGHEFAAELRWQATPALALRGGYRLLSMSAEDGTDTTYFSDGTAGESDLDEVSTVRDGFTVGLELVF